MVGKGYSLFAELMDRVRFAYRESHCWVNRELARLPQKDAQAMNILCRQFYSHTFFARYHYQKPNKIVLPTLQTASTVRQFSTEAGWRVVCLHCPDRTGPEARRGLLLRTRVKVVFPNEDLHELDVVCLPAGQPPT